jgi:hypothetical protein
MYKCRFRQGYIKKDVTGVTSVTNQKSPMNTHKMEESRCHRKVSQHPKHNNLPDEEQG